MELDFWLAKWNNAQTGFHQSEFNRYLTNYWSLLEIPPDSHVLVPLCGKSLDMLWLRRQGYNVLGIEISELAVNQFFAENDLPYTVNADIDFNRHESTGIALWQGDFFRTTSRHVAETKALFDRAALVALPPSMRQRYARHLSEILPEATKILLVTFEYDTEKMQGPPFSVDEAEVLTLFLDRFHIDLIHTQDALAFYPAFETAGVSRLTEKIYLLTSRK